MNTIGDFILSPLGICVAIIAIAGIAFIVYHLNKGLESEREEHNPYL